MGDLQLAALLLPIGYVLIKLADKLLPYYDRALLRLFEEDDA